MTIELVEYFPPIYRTRIYLIGVGASGITSELLQYIKYHRPRGMKFVIADVATGIPEKSAHCKIARLDDSWLHASSSPREHRDHNDALEDIRQIVKGGDVIFVVSEMGETLGEAALSIAATCKEMDILTVGVAIMPSDGECSLKRKIASTNLNIFQSVTDSLLIVDDQLRSKLTGSDPSLHDFIHRTNASVGTAIIDICKMVSIDTPNGADIEDFKTALKCTGSLSIGVGKASGENRVHEVVEQAMRSARKSGKNLLDGQGVLILLKAGAFIDSEKPGEPKQIERLLRKAFAVDANVINVIAWEDSFDEELSLTVIVAGLDHIIHSTSIALHKPHDALYKPQRMQSESNACSDDDSRV